MKNLFRKHLNEKISDCISRDALRGEHGERARRCYSVSQPHAIRDGNTNTFSFRNTWNRHRRRGGRYVPGTRISHASKLCRVSARPVTRSDPTGSIPQAQGENAPFNQTILRFPGVAQDSFGQLHVRGEHANLQYRIDDVLLPESIPGFGQELATRFADNISLMTGALPAQFGFRTTGVIDIHTKNGALFTGDEASIYVGSFDTIMESFERGGVIGKFSYYVTESYLHDGIGIENPTRSSSPIDDDTDQYKFFGYFSDIIDETSRVTLLVGANHSDFEIPNNPGQKPAFNDMGRSTFNSAKLDENRIGGF